MVLQTIRHALLICFLLSIFGNVATGLSRTDGSEYVGKTVESEDGDIYDCVDFYKQPAFDHPLLKNHSFHPQMRPTFQPQMIRNNDVSWEMNATETDIPLLKDGGCPQGTVPIRKMNKSSGISGTNVHLQRYSKAKISNKANVNVSGTILAVVQTKGNIGKVYNGVGATISVYNPRVLPSQYSSAEIMLKGGTDFITAGWTVNPIKYKDSKTRFFISTVAGDMHCFDSECGFVLVRSDYPLNFVLKPVSVRDGKVFVNKFFIYRDPTWGAWWLQFGMKNPPITLGFWPQKIFKGLQQSATYAACGGEVYTPAGLQAPEMGTGYLPNYERDDAAFCRDYVVVNDKNTIVTVKDTEPYENSNFYGAIDQYNRPGHYVIFGGPAHADDVS
ncbi:protein neprosin-like [Silene latifolia]|uniref:protein neprosin-like n=1 Tax=Silene latifolia TaxID=37657 RepID=UPI003D77ED44